MNFMSFNIKTYKELQFKYAPKGINIIAVSKTKPVSDILEAYQFGVRDFGENYVQELLEKQLNLPADIRWHFIGHLQTNKVKYISPFVQLIHGTDSEKLLLEIDKQAKKNNRVIDILLQVHIATEESKFGMDDLELDALIQKYFNSVNTDLQNIRVCGLMGMASFSDDQKLVSKEFSYLKSIFEKYRFIQKPNFHFQILSMGMSADADIAAEEGSTMIRIGSALFGSRT